MTKSKASKKYSYNQLIELVEDNNIDGLKAAFKAKNLDANVTNSLGQSVLHYAASSNNVEIMNIITSHPKTDINAKDKSKMTPLMYAAKCGKSRAVKFLLKKGADVLCSDENGCNALWFACISGNSRCAEGLLRQKVPLSEKEKRKWADKFIDDARIMEMIKKLIIEGSDPYYESTFGDVLLCYGCEKGLFDTVKLIVDKNIVNIDKVDYRGESPLHLSLRGSFAQIADYMIQKGASLAIKNNNFKKSAYEYAAMYDRTETILVKYEPEEEFLDEVFTYLIWYKRYKTLSAYSEKFATKRYPNGPNLLNRVIYLALSKDKHECVNILVSKLNDMDFIVKTAKDAIAYWTSGNFKRLYTKFLELKPTDAQIKNERSVLASIAIEKGSIYSLEYLLEQGLDPNEIVDGDPYLIQACRTDNYSNCFELLLKFGADPHVKDREGFTPLLLSAYKGRYRVFTELFKLDKNLNQRSNDQLTPFLAACRSGNTDIVSALMKAGACVTDVDNQNRNCLHFAANHKFLCELIFEKLEKSDLYSMVIAEDAQGQRPLDSIILNNHERVISNLCENIPNLLDLIKSPMFFTIYDSDPEMCLICRDEMLKYYRAVVLPCKHMYHAECYKEWGNQRKICPYCQKPAFK